MARDSLMTRCFGPAASAVMKGKLVGAQVSALIALEFGRQKINHPRVKILATQKGITIGAFDLEYPIANLKHRDIERAAAKVIDRDPARCLLAQPIGQGRSSGFLEDAQNLKPSNLAGIFRGLTLRVVEIRGHGDHRLRPLFAQKGFRRFLHLPKDEGADLRRRILRPSRLNQSIAIVALHDVLGHQTLVLANHRIIKATPDPAFYGVDGVCGVRDRLPLGGLSDQTLSILRKGHDAWGGPRAFAVFNHPDVLALHDGHAGIRGAKIDPDNFAQGQRPFQSRGPGRMNVGQAGEVLSLAQN